MPGAPKVRMATAHYSTTCFAFSHLFHDLSIAWDYYSSGNLNYNHHLSNLHLPVAWCFPYSASSWSILAPRFIPMASHLPARQLLCHSLPRPLLVFQLDCYWGHPVCILFHSVPRPIASLFTFSLSPTNPSTSLLIFFKRWAPFWFLLSFIMF